MVRSLPDLTILARVDDWIYISRAILHDPEEYPNPEEFRPERFLRAEASSKEVRDPRMATFGFGRR